MTYVPSRRVLAAAATLVTALALIAAPAQAHRPQNPWLRASFLDIAHQGGENEAPSNTMYAFRRAAAAGADMLEADVHATADDVLVAVHDASVTRTTGGAGLVREMTFREVRRLDAAFNFVPGRSAQPGLPADAYPLRGIRTHDRRPPRGFSPADFAIPSLGEILTRFPHRRIGIEIKGTSDADTASFLHNARLLARLLHRMHRTHGVVVTSFNDLAVAEFHRLAPKVAIAPGMVGLTQYFLAGVRPIDGTTVERLLDERGIARPGTPGAEPCPAGESR